MTLDLHARLTRPSIAFEAIRKSYRGQTVLAATDLDIRAGEFVTFLGPSGSGKTTLLNIVAGIVAPDAGRMLFGERDVTHASSRARGVGMVFQNYALMPHYTVFENVAFPLRIRKLASATIAAKVRDALDLVGMGHLAERKPAQLSGGQQQRVSIARCLVYEPSIVLMDEPLGALDKQLRVQLQSEIKRLHETLGFTTLYVTHDQDEAMSLSDRVCLMNDGKIVQIDTPADIYARPRTRFAAEFLGEANLIPVVAHTNNGTTVLRGPQAIECRIPQTLADGSEHLMLLRPESLYVLNPGETMDHQISATVERLAFFGNRIQLTVDPGADQRLTVFLQNTPDLVPLRAGDHVRIGWHSRAAALIPPDPRP